MRALKASTIAFALWIAAQASPAEALCIGCSCTISADPIMQFANVNPIAGPPAQAVARIDVSCFVLVGVGTLSNEIRLSAGQANAYWPRRMSDGLGHSLAYNLYLPTNQVWGDGGSGTSFYTRSSFSIAVGAPTSYSVDITGRIEAAGLSSAYPGVYDDTITVTVTW